MTKRVGEGKIEGPRSSNRVPIERESGRDILRRAYAEQPSPEEVRKQKQADRAKQAKRERDGSAWKVNR